MKLNSIVIALGSILVLVAISIGCSKPAKEGVAAVKAANDSPTTRDATTVAVTGRNTLSNQRTFNVVKTSDQGFDSTSEFEIKQRLWQDFDYLFSTQATVTGFTPDGRSVKLLKANGVNIEVEIAILCEEDQQYLSSISDDHRSKLTAN